MKIQCHATLSPVGTQVMAWTDTGRPRASAAAVHAGRRGRQMAGGAGGVSSPCRSISPNVLFRLAGRNFSSIWPGCVRVSAAPHLDLLEHRMVFYPREEDSHCVRAILQERDSGSIQLLSELVDVGLQLCKRCGESKRTVKLGEEVPEQNQRVEVHHQATVEPRGRWRKRSEERRGGMKVLSYPNMSL